MYVSIEGSHKIFRHVPEAFYRVHLFEGSGGTLYGTRGETQCSAKAAYSAPFTHYFVV